MRKLLVVLLCMVVSCSYCFVLAEERTGESRVHQGLPFGMDQLSFGASLQEVEEFFHFTDKINGGVLSDLSDIAGFKQVSGWMDCEYVGEVTYSAFVLDDIGLVSCSFSSMNDEMFENYILEIMNNTYGLPKKCGENSEIDYYLKYHYGIYSHYGYDEFFNPLVYLCGWNVGDNRICILYRDEFGAFFICSDCLRDSYSDEFNEISEFVFTGSIPETIPDWRSQSEYNRQELAKDGDAKASQMDIYAQEINIEETEVENDNEYYGTFDDGADQSYYPESFEHEVFVDSYAETAVIDSTISRETLSNGTREQILQARGIFDTNSLINVTGVDFSSENNNQNMQVYFQDGVYVGGSEGYEADWLTTNGSVSEAYSDLDGDGTEEYILIYLVSEQVTEYDYTSWRNTWNIAIYEPEGNTLKLACEFPFSFSNWGDRFAKIVQTDSGRRIMIADINYWDGGGGGVSATLYGYDGENAYIDIIMNATVGEDSYIAFGPFDVDDDERIIEALNAASYDQSALSSVNLIEGENCEVYRSNYDENGRVYHWDEQIDSNSLNPKAFTGFDKITQAAKEHGVIAGYSIDKQIEDGYQYEYYNLRLLGGDTTLLEASEGWDDTSNQSYIDITVHYADDPIVIDDNSDNGIVNYESKQNESLATPETRPVGAPASESTGQETSEPDSSKEVLYGINGIYISEQIQLGEASVESSSYGLELYDNGWGFFKSNGDEQIIAWKWDEASRNGLINLEGNFRPFTAEEGKLHFEVGENTVITFRYEQTTGSLPETLDRGEPVWTDTVEETSGEGFEYDVIDDDRIEITGYHGNAANLRIPAQIDGKLVFSIGFCAFSSNVAIQSVEFEEGIASLEKGAFIDCAALESVRLPESLTFIGAGAFENCVNLTRINLPTGLTTIYSSAFENCPSLILNVVPESFGESFCVENGLPYVLDATKESSSGFVLEDEPLSAADTDDFEYTSVNGGCAITDYHGSTRDIVIPSELGGMSVVAIDELAFYGNEVLTSVVVPDSVRSIGEGAFYDCKNLTSIVLPDALSDLGAYALENCEALTKLTLPSGITHLSAGVLEGCSGLTELTIPGSVVYTGDFACSGLTSLETLIIEEGFTWIGAYSFSKCSSLTTLYLPASLTEINYDSFDGCMELTDIHAPEGSYAASWAANFIPTDSEADYYEEEAYEVDESTNESIEMSDYLWSDLSSAASSMGLDQYRHVEREMENEYYNNSAMVAGYQAAEYFVVEGWGYSLFGCTVGMDRVDALNMLNIYSCDVWDDPYSGGISFEHRYWGGSYIDFEDYDGFGTIEMSGDTVVSIAYCSYTG